MCYYNSFKTRLTQEKSSMSFTEKFHEILLLIVTCGTVGIMLNLIKYL